MVKDLVFEWRHQPVRIRMQKECGVLDLAEDEKLGPFKEGDEVKLPYWQAKIMVNQNCHVYRFKADSARRFA